MKKLLSVLLVCVMLLSLAPAALASEEIAEIAEIAEEVTEEASVEEAPAEKPVDEPEAAPAADGAGDIAINATNFPDANFRSFVKQYDLNSDSRLSSAELAAVTTMECSSKSIADLTGIECFTALTYLDCFGNQLTSLDVSKNTALTMLYCACNKLTFLDVRKNIALKTLSCGSNNLTQLDVSKNTALTKLYCDSIKLTSLDVSENTALTVLWCWSNNLTSLDVSKNTALTELRCNGNQLTSLDVSKNIALTVLECNINKLTQLDVRKNIALTALICGSNKLTQLDVSKNTKLTALSCFNNQLTSLDVSTVPSIRDAVLNGTKDTSEFDYDKYTSSQGTLLVGKTMTIVTDNTPTTLTRADFTSLETELTPGEPFPSAFGIPAEGSGCKDSIHFWEDYRGDVVSGIPKEGKYYWLNVYIEPDAGYTFGEKGTEVPVYADGVYVGSGVVENGVYGRDELLHLRLQRTGPAPAVISGAEITVSAPVQGAAIAADGIAAAGARFTIGEQYWCTEKKLSAKVTSGTFENGKTYYYYARLVPNEGWAFPGRPANYLSDSELAARVNGTAAAERYKYADGDAYIFVPFKVAGPTYTGDVSITGLTMPSAGAAVAADGKADGYDYSITSQSWTDTQMKPITAFENGTMYVYECRVTPTGGRVFPSDWAGAVNVNGEKLEPVNAIIFAILAVNGEEAATCSVKDGVLTVRLARKAGVLLGDVDHNGKVQPADAAMTLKNDAACDMAAADVSGDGKVTRLDAALILQYCVGDLKAFPAE